MAAEIKIGAKVENIREIEELNQRLNQLQDTVKRGTSDKTKNIKLSEDTADANEEIRRRITESTPIELKKIRISQDQIKYQKEWNKGEKDAWKNRKEEYEQKLKLAKIDESGYRKGMMRTEAKERTDKIRDTLKIIKAREKESSVYEKQIDLVEQYSKQQEETKPSVVGGMVTGAGQGLGLGGVVGAARLGVPTLAAYAGYQLGKYGLAGIRIESEMTTAAEQNLLLTEKYGKMLGDRVDIENVISKEDSKEKESIIARAKISGMMPGIQAQVERNLSMTAGATKENLEAYNRIQEKLKFQGYKTEEITEIMEDIPNLIRIMGPAKAEQMFPAMYAATRRAKLPAEMMTQIMPIAGAYQQMLRQRGISITGQEAGGVAGAFGGLGTMYQGPQGAAIATGMAETFGAGGGAGEAGQALIYRALLGRGMSYYEIRKAISSKKLGKYMEPISEQIKTEFGTGKEGVLAFQSLFPTISVNQAERMFEDKNFAKSMGTAVEIGQEDVTETQKKREIYDGTKKSAEEAKEIAKQDAADASFDGLSKWWNQMAREVFLDIRDGVRGTATPRFRTDDERKIESIIEGRPLEGSS